MLFVWSRVKVCNESYGTYDVHDDGGIPDDN